MIRLLSDSTINKIAAGEVIERPASVIKELVENSIDAGSDNIDIILEQAGKNLIIISDNGSGMALDELKLAVQRHTTSKLDEEDLLNIHSFGFRGEALPSIGAISKMSITSKRPDDLRAYQISIEGGIEKEVKTVIHNVGTKIEIRDLFFATPARLKFLRSDNSEFSSCLEIIKKIALAHPKISFSLSHNGKNILKVRAIKEASESFLYKERIIDLLGNEFVENASFVNLERPELVITGYTSLPTYNKASANDQFLFINNRPVKDKLLNIALRVAYQDSLARDRHPICVLFLQIDPQLVDVNVHPAKSEVRFYDPNLVKSLIISSINDALSSTAHKTSTHIASNALGFFSKNTSPLKNDSNNFLERKNYEYKIAPLSNIVPNYNLQQERLIDTKPHPKIENDLQEDTIFKTEYKNSANYPLGVAKAQLHNTYIISQTENSIIIVDQHAAHERLGYEKIKEFIAKNGFIKQRLLIPEIVELSEEKYATSLNDKRAELKDMGLVIEKFGAKSIIVSEIPSIISDSNINKLIKDLGDHLFEIGENVALNELIEHITETYACHYSIRAGRSMSILEMNELLRQMENTRFSGQCNHGRPTYIELKLKDIEKLFGRL